MTTQKIERIEDIRAGDKVTLVADNGNTLTGVAQTWNDSTDLYVFIDAYAIPISDFETKDHWHWSAEREVPDLPTEPGFYLDSTGDCWELQSDGQWFPFGGYGSVPQLAIVETYAPFTRLVREGAEAKKIAKWLRNENVSLIAAEVIERGDWKGDK